jgi:hypothetical protein
MFIPYGVLNHLGITQDQYILDIFKDAYFNSNNKPYENWWTLNSDYGILEPSFASYLMYNLWNSGTIPSATQQNSGLPGASG